VACYVQVVGGKKSLFVLLLFDNDNYTFNSNNNERVAVFLVYHQMYYIFVEMNSNRTVNMSFESCHHHQSFQDMVSFSFYPISATNTLERLV